MALTPGFYCGTAGAVFPVDYCNIPDARIYTAGRFFFKQRELKPGQRIFGEFTSRDENVWARIPDRLKTRRQN